MTSGVVVKLSFILLCVAYAVGYYLISQGTLYALYFIHALYFIPFLILWFIFMASVLYEVFRSTRIGLNEKIMWATALLLINPIIGLIYILSGRRRIVS